MATPSQNQEQLIQSVLQENYWQELITLLQKEANLTPHKETASKLYLEIGKIYLQELRDPRQAMSTLLKGLELNDAYPPLLKACEQLAILGKDASLFERLVVLQQKTLDGASTTEQNYALQLQAGKAWLETFNSPSKALPFVKAAHQLQPQEPAPLQLLVQIYEATHQWQELVSCYQALMSCSDAPTQAAIRIKLFFLYFYKLNQPEEALSTILPANNDPQAMLLLNRTLSRLKRWRELATNLNHLARASKDESLIKSYLLQRAELCHLKCGEIDAAIQDLQLVVRMEPSNRNALERLAMIYRQDNQGLKLLETLQLLFAVEIKAGRQDEFVSLAVEIARLIEQHLHDDDKAIEILKTATQKAPKSLPVITALARHYRKRGRWQELKEVYEAELACSEDTNQSLSLYYRIADLQEGSLNDVEGAIVTYRRAVEISANYLPVTQRLTRLYTQKQRWQELIELMELELKIVDNNGRAISLLNKIANVYDEKLQDKTAAEAAYQRILAIDQRDLAAVTALARLYQQNEEWNKLIEMSLKEAQLCGDPSQAISLYYDAGVICEEKLNNQDMAAMCYQNILSISPTYIPALRALGQNYANKDNWGGLIAMYHREAQVTSDQEKQLFLMTRIAEIFADKLRDPASSERTLQEVLQKNPNYVPALRLLEHLFTEAARHEDLVSLYRSIIHHGKTHDESIGATSLKLAKLLHLELEQLDESEQYYLKAIDHGFGVNTCIAALDQIYSQSSRFRELADLLVSVLQKIQEPSYLLNILYRLGIIQIEYLEQADEGMSNLLQAHKINADDLPILWDLTRYLEQHKRWQVLAELYEKLSGRAHASAARRIELLRQAANYYKVAGNQEKAILLAEQILQSNEEDLGSIELAIDVYRANQSHEKLAAMLRKSMALQKDEERRLAAAREVANLYENKLEQPEKAIAVLEKILEETHEFNYPTLANLEKLLLKKKDWQKLTTIYPRLLTGIQDPESVVKLELRHGEAYENLKQSEKALEIYKKALLLSPRQSVVRGRIKTLMRNLELWEDLVMHLSEDAAHPASTAEPFWEIGDIYERQLKKNDLAIDFYRRALGKDPRYLAAYESASRVYLIEKKWNEFLALSEQELAINKKPDRHLALRLQRGRALRDQLKQSSEAVLEFNYGLQQATDDINCLRELANTYEELKNWSEAIKCYEKLLSLQPVNINSPVEAKTSTAQLYHRLGEIALNGMRNEEKCIEFNERALTLLPYFHAAIDRLTEIYKRQQDWKKLVGVYQRSIDVLRPKEPQKALPLHITLGELYEGQLNQPTQATQEYQRALQLDKDYIPAHKNLSALFSKNPQFYPLAINEFIYLLNNGQPEVAYFKQIARMFEEQNKFDHLCHVYETMDFLQIIDPGDREIYKSYASRIPQEFTGTLDKTLAQRFLFHPSEQQPLQELLTQVFVDLGAFSRHTRDSLSLSRKERLTNKDRHPVRTLVNRICAAFQLPEETELYLKSGLGMPTAVIVDEGAPALAVDEQWLKTWNRHQLSFFLASELSQVIHNRVIAVQMGAYDFERLVRLILLPFLREAPPNTPEIERDIKLIKKVLSRKTRKWIEENGEKTATRLEKTDFKEWVNGIKLSSYRAGLVFCNKLDEAIYAYKSTLKEEISKKPWDTESIRAMILYTLSDECGTIRKALGTSIYSV